MVSSSPVSLSVLRGVCLRPVVVSLLFSLAGLSWFGGKYAVADAHTLPPKTAISYRNGPFSLPVDINPTLPSDDVLRNMFTMFPGQGNRIQKRQANDKELLDRIYKIFQQLKHQQDSRPVLTMPSLRFRKK